MRLVALIPNGDGTYTLHKVLLVLDMDETRVKLGKDIATFKTEVAAIKYCRTYGYVMMEVG